MLNKKSDFKRNHPVIFTQTVSRARRVKYHPNGKPVIVKITGKNLDVMPAANAQFKMKYMEYPLTGYVLVNRDLVGREMLLIGGIGVFPLNLFTYEII